MGTVLPDLINPMQIGFMRNRFIAKNIILLSNIIHHCNVERVPAYLLSFDFYKAFDSVEWDAIAATLEHLNFGEYYINLIAILQADITSCVTNNGYWSSWFNVTRGSRQGCPNSPLTFNLVIEILAAKLRQNPQIRGISINGIEQIGAQYADDL